MMMSVWLLFQYARHWGLRVPPSDGEFITYWYPGMPVSWVGGVLGVVPLKMIDYSAGPIFQKGIARKDWITVESFRMRLVEIDWEYDLAIVVRPGWRGQAIFWAYRLAHAVDYGYALVFRQLMRWHILRMPELDTYRAKRYQPWRYINWPRLDLRRHRGNIG